MLEQSSRHSAQKWLWQAKYLATKTYSVYSMQFTELPQNRHMPHETGTGRRHAWHELLMPHFGQSRQPGYATLLRQSASLPGSQHSCSLCCVALQENISNPLPLLSKKHLGRNQRSQDNISPFSDPYHSGGEKPHLPKGCTNSICVSTAQSFYGKSLIYNRTAIALCSGRRHLPNPRNNKTLKLIRLNCFFGGYFSNVI